MTMVSQLDDNQAFYLGGANGTLSIKEIKD